MLLGPTSSSRPVVLVGGLLDVCDGKSVLNFISANKSFTLEGVLVDIGGAGVLLDLGGGVDVLTDVEVLSVDLTVVDLGVVVLVVLTLELVDLTVELILTLELDDGGGESGSEHPTSKNVYGDMGFKFVLSPAGTSKSRQFASP